MSLNSDFVFSTMQRYALFTMPYSLFTLFDRKACGADMEFAADMANLAITVARTTIKTTFPLKNLVHSTFLAIFALETLLDMSEDIKDIETKSDIVGEPVAALATDYEGGVVAVHDEIDDLDWDRMPIFGPKTLDEAIARIDQAWEDRNDPSKWMTSEQMWNHLYEKHPWLK